MIDSMNAEIALGTITNVNEAVQWMGYTYLFGASFVSPPFVFYRFEAFQEVNR